MSADATAYVWRYSPYRGNTFLVHLAVADSVNDQHENRFWLPQATTATKTRATDRTVRDALAVLESDGFLTRVRGGKAAGSLIEYRFIFKRHLPVVYDARRPVDKRSEDSSHRSETAAGGSETSSDRTEEELNRDKLDNSLKVVGDPAARIRSLKPSKRSA